MKDQQSVRFLASGLVTVFLLVIITRAVMMLLTYEEYLLWGIPVIR